MDLVPKPMRTFRVSIMGKSGRDLQIRLPALASLGEDFRLDAGAISP